MHVVSRNHVWLLSGKSSYPAVSDSHNLGLPPVCFKSMVPIWHDLARWHQVSANTEFRFPVIQCMYIHDWEHPLSGERLSESVKLNYHKLSSLSNQVEILPERFLWISPHVHMGMNVGFRQIHHTRYCSPSIVFTRAHIGDYSDNQSLGRNSKMLRVSKL